MRLDDVNEHFGDAISIEWRSFMLRPTAAQRKSRAEFVEYTKLWSQMPEADSRLEVTSPWASEHEHPSHSLPALAATKLAASYGPELDAAFHRDLFLAYFRDNQTISDTDVLVDRAAGIGIDADDFRRRLTDDDERWESEVIADHREAQRLGINAVPSMVIDNRFLVPGAQEVETYIQVIDEAFASR